MKVVLQRVKEANVIVDNNIIGQIDKGVVALIGIKSTDNNNVIEYMVNKIINLRIFEDQDGKLNKSVLDEEGGILLVPNFTVYGNAKKGTRPSYIESAPSDEADKIFNQLVEKFKEKYKRVETGKFKADMEVNIKNDGPVTIIIEKEI